LGRPVLGTSSACWLLASGPVAMPLLMVLVRDVRDSPALHKKLSPMDLAGTDPTVKAENETLAMIYRRQVEFAVATALASKSKCRPIPTETTAHSTLTAGLSATDIVDLEHCLDVDNTVRQKRQFCNMLEMHQLCIADCLADARSSNGTHAQLTKATSDQQASSRCVTSRFTTHAQFTCCLVTDFDMVANRTQDGLVQHGDVVQQLNGASTTR